LRNWGTGMSWDRISNWIGWIGVATLAVQLVKLFGLVLSLYGPIEWIIDLVEDAIPLLTQWLNIQFGLDLNGFEIMSMSVAISGTMIVVSSIATKAPMKTIYIFRFFLIPYALFVIILAIIVQVITPFMELRAFHGACKANPFQELYGNDCVELGPQLRFLETFFGGQVEGGLTEGENAAGMPLMLSIIALLLVATLAVIVFFFKRLRVNKLLRRIVVAILSAVALALGSAAVAVAKGDATWDEIKIDWTAGFQ